MELTTDVALRGINWAKVLEKYNVFFQPRAHYELYMLALAIGIMYDKRIEKPEEDPNIISEPPTVPRNVMQNNANDKLDYYFQAAILSTKTEELTEDERLELAFGDKQGFSKIKFLTSFANFGASKLAELIGISDFETMDNLKSFLIKSKEGFNFEIDELPDDALFNEFALEDT